MATKLQAVIFDWAGTTVDYGCFAPVAAFREAFAGFGVTLSDPEIRGPMGLLKRDHLRTLLRDPAIAARWREARGRDGDEADVEALNLAFERRLMATLADHAQPLPGVPALVEDLRRRGLKLGSTTGFTRAMMEVVAPAAGRLGYAPDCLVCADEVPAGRPAPHMIERNREQLGLADPRAILKVGDTVSDIEEGKNAGVWSVGVLRGGSELGLSEIEVAELPTPELHARLAVARARLLAAGADAILDHLTELPALIQRLEAGELISP
jgi:phosphonoacetaldehyde hydrolase